MFFWKKKSFIFLTEKNRETLETYPIYYFNELFEKGKN